MAVDVGQVLINLSENVQDLELLVTGAAYVLGLASVFKGFYHLKVYGEARTMMATNTSLKQPLSYILIGAIFIYLPTAIDVFMASTFGDATILSISDWRAGSMGENEDAVIAVLRIVQFLGLAAFIRGWMIISKSVQQSGQGNAGKGAIHIIAGIFAMNIIQTANILYDTLGVSFTGGS